MLSWGLQVETHSPRAGRGTTSVRQSQTKRYRRNIWYEIEALQANKNPGGCALGQHCKLSHEKPGATDSTGTSQNKINGLTKEAQTNGRPALRPYHSESNYGQPSGAGVSLGTGNDNQANGHTNYKSPIEGMTAAREVWKQHKDAVIGYRHEGPRSRGVQEALNFNSRDGGVALGSSSAYDGSSQAKKASDTHNSQYGHPIRPAPTVERIDKAVGKNHNIDSSSHGSISSHRRDLPSQNWSGNWQKNRSSHFAQRPARDQNGMTRGPNPGLDLIPKTKLIGVGNGTVGTARLPADARDLSNAQTRVIFHDPKFPAMAERQWESRSFPSNVYRASVSSELPAATSHTSTETPRIHEWKGHQTQEGLSHTSPLLGDPGGSKQVPKYGVVNGFARAGLTQGLPEGARSELRGGGVALNNYPRTNYIPENKNGSISIEASNALAKVPTKDLKVETNSSERNLVKSQDYGIQGSSTYFASRSPGGTGDGGEIQSQLVSAMRKAGKMDPKATPWSPEATRRGSTGSSLGEGNRTGHSNLEGAAKILLKSDTGFTSKKQIGNGFLGSTISGSLGNRPVVSQQASTARPIETPPRKHRGPGFNEMRGSEGGAKIGGIEHDEHEEGGAKLPIEQNVQLEPYYSRADVGPVKNNRPMANDAVSPLQGISPPLGLKNQSTYTGGQNQYYLHNSGQEYHSRTNSAVPFRDGYRSGIQKPGPRYSHQFWPEVEGARHIVPYQSSGHSYGVAVVPNNITPTRLQLDNRNVPLGAGFVPNPAREPFRGPQSQLEPVSHHRLDRIIRSPQALSFHPASDLSSLYRPQNLNQSPPAMLSYESSLNSQVIQSDTEQNRRSYTPEPEELDRSALRLYYDDRRIEAKASDMSRDLWEGNSRIKVDLQ